MKKIVAALLTFALMLSLASCKKPNSDFNGGGNNNENNSRFI